MDTNEKLCEQNFGFDPCCPCEACGKKRVELHEKHLGKPPTPLGRNVWEVFQDLSAAREEIERLKGENERLLEVTDGTVLSELLAERAARKEAENLLAMARTELRQAERQVGELTAALAKQKQENYELRQELDRWQPKPGTGSGGIFGFKQFIPRCDVCKVKHEPHCSPDQANAELRKRLGDNYSEGRTTSLAAHDVEQREVIVAPVIPSWAKETKLLPEIRVEKERLQCPEHGWLIGIEVCPCGFDPKEGTDTE